MKIELDLTAATRTACESMLSKDIRESLATLVGSQLEAKAIQQARKEAADEAGEAVKAETILDDVKAIIGNVAAEAENSETDVAELAKAAAWLYRDAATRNDMKGGTIDAYTSFIANIPAKLAKGSISMDWLSEAKQAQMQYLCASESARNRSDLKGIIAEATKTLEGESSEARDKRVKAMLDAVRGVLSAEFVKDAKEPARKAA